jgi:hypothetical protein
MNILDEDYGLSKVGVLYQVQGSPHFIVRCSLFNGCGHCGCCSAVLEQSKNNLINDDGNNIDSHTCLMEQAFNKPYPTMEHKFTTTKEIEHYKFLK